LDRLYYRGCWHRLSRSFLLGSLKPCGLAPLRQRFTTRKPSSRTRHRSVRLAPIAEDSRLQPPVGVWAVLSPSEWGHALTPHTRLSLGEPLPRQQADRPQAPPKVVNLWSGDIIWYYPRVSMAIPDLGAGTYVLLSLSPLSTYCYVSRSTCMPNPCRQRSF
jgi:hypothetical protein